MNKKQKLILGIGTPLVIIALIVICIFLYQPIKICNQILPYSKDNYCVAVSFKLPKIRKQCKLKYSLLDKVVLTQIFTNIKDFRANTDKDYIDELLAPDVIGDLDKRNAKIDEMVQNYIKALEEAIEANKYHAKQLKSQSNTLDFWNNALTNLNLEYGESITAELEENLRKAKEEGIFDTDIATRLRKFRALGTPYCEISSLGEITDCSGQYVGTVENVFKPLGSNNQSDTKKSEKKDERIIISQAVKAYHDALAKETAKVMNVSVDCAHKYNEILNTEGYENGQSISACTQAEIQSITAYRNKDVEFNGLVEPLYSNAGMPKSLVLKGVSIMCFEKANIEDNSYCTPKELDTIKNFFKENADIDWSKETFMY